jgi:hypothetical protein
LVNKSHFKVNLIKMRRWEATRDLSEFGLPIFPPCFITIAARNLEVFLKASDHQELFVLLWALRERVELPRLARSDQEFARAFRRRFEERRRLNFDKTAPVEEVARGFAESGAKANVALQLGLSKVEIAILHERLLRDRCRLNPVEAERQPLCHVQNAQIIGVNLPHQ